MLSQEASCWHFCCEHRITECAVFLIEDARIDTFFACADDYKSLGCGGSGDDAN